MDALYISYWSFADPLFQSQSLPYLRGLRAHGYRFVVVTFEQPPHAMSDDEQSATRTRLLAEGIEWVPLTYTKSPPVVSTMFDIARGAIVSALIARRCRLVHARSTVPGAIGYLASRVSHRPFFYDADGPLSQEYVDVGHWNANSIPSRLTRWMENRALRAADKVAVLTKARATEIRTLVAQPISVLPCAVDSALFRPQPTTVRTETRTELGLHGTVFVYAGKPGGWYLTREMFAFLAAARTTIPDLSVLILTGSDPGAFEEAAREHGLPIVVRRGSRDQMPRLLSAADVGLSFIKPAPSKLACSPIKNAEYLSCGLPIVTTTGVGDYTDLVRNERVGIVVDPGRPETFTDKAGALRVLLSDPGLATRCRAVAERDLSLPVVVNQYLDIYKRLLHLPEAVTPSEVMPDAAGCAQP